MSDSDSVHSVPAIVRMERLIDDSSIKAAPPVHRRAFEREV